MKTVFYIIIFLFSSFLSWYGCSQSKNLDSLCAEIRKSTTPDKKDPLITDLSEVHYECCQKSLAIIKKNSYKVLPLHARGTCPKGTEKNMLRCMGTLRWCEPKSTSASLIYIPPENFDVVCKTLGGCCQRSVEIVKKNSYLALNAPASTNCPKGTKKNLLKCKGSLTWCEPENKSPE